MQIALPLEPKNGCFSSYLMAANFLIFGPLIKHITDFSPMNSKCVLPFKFRAQAIIFNAAKKHCHPLLWKIYLHKFFCLFYIISIPKQFVKLRAISKLFFLILVAV